MQQASEKKYTILENETFEYKGNTLHRIQALKDFSNVKAGDKGGWVSGYHNLSQEGECWVYDEAKVFDEAIVSDNARIGNNAEVLKSAKVYNMAIVYGHAYITDEVTVFDNSQVFGKVWIYGNAKILDYANVNRSAQVYGDVLVHGRANISGNAVIEKDSDYEVFKNNWSSGRYFTYTKSNKMWKVGCFYGTGEELIKKAYQDSELSGKMYEKYVKFVKSQE